MSDAATPRVRPGSVTALVILMWIGVGITLLFAVVLFLAGAGVSASSLADVTASLIRDFNLSPTRAESIAKVLGPLMLVGGGVLLIAAFVQALLAVFISRGSNVARILVTILIGLRILSVLATLAQGFGGGIVLYVITELLFDILLLVLLYNRAANQFFTNRVG